MKLLSIILIFCLGTIVYSNSFHCSFHFDDQTFIIENNAIKDIHDLQHIWNYYPGRFVTFLSLAVNYHFNGLDVFNYHVFNLIVHLITAILVWWLVLLTFSTPAMEVVTIEKKSTGKKPVYRSNRIVSLGHANIIALFAGLVFVSHPVQIEAVTFIWQRAASMTTLFYLASLCFYIKSRDAINGVSTAYYICSLITAIVAMITKEIALTLPLIILLYEYTFLKGKDKLNCIRLLPFLLTIFVIPLLTLVTNSEKVSYIHGSVETPGGITPIQYVLTEFRVMVTYVRLFFLPLNQNLDYDYPISRSIFEWPTLLSLLFLITVLLGAQRLFSKYKFISFSILWFFITSLTEAIPYPVKDVIFEHRLYLPMVGYSMFLAGGVYYLLMLKRDAINGVSTVMVVILTMIIGFNSFLTYQRNKCWKDELTLIDDIIQKSPLKSRPYNDRAFYYESMGRYKEAMSDYTEAIELANPVNAEPYYNRGNVYSELGKFAQATLDYNKAIGIDPGYAEAYHNRGRAWDKLGDRTQALSDYNKAIELTPDDPQAYYERGFLFIKQDNFTQALSDFSKVIALDPDDANAYNNRGRIYDIQGNLKQALADYNKAIELNPKLEMAYSNRKALYEKLNR